VTPPTRLRLARWTLTTGSNTQSRAAVVVESDDHQWQASADGNGAVSALLHAVDKALADVLAGHPRLVAYTVTAIGEGPDAEGKVELAIQPPADAPGPRAQGIYGGQSQGPNIIASSVEAYVEALGSMLAEAPWQGATERPGDRRRRRRTKAVGTDVVFDEGAADQAANWFDP